MSNTTSAQLVPAFDADVNKQPNLSVVPPPVTRRRSPMELNREQAGELNKTGLICLAAQKTAYATVLADHDISATYVTTLVTDVATARTRSMTAVQATGSKKSATNLQDVCARKLLRGLRVVQIAARQKYRYNDPAKLGDYYIGQRIDESRPVLDQSSLAILNKATADGYRTEWKACTASQSTEQSAATTQRAERNAMVDSIQQRRIELQFAADAAWPWSNPENAGVRGEFKLPRTRPLTF